MQQAEKRSWWLWALLTVLKFDSFSKAGENELLLPSNVHCACSDQPIRFTCTVAVIGVTIWTGTVFNCDMDGNEIFLRHSRFNESGGTSGSCNNGAITARSVGVDGNCYTSELSVRTSTEMNGRTVRCVSNSNMLTVGDATITITSGPYQQAPANVNLVNVRPGELTFSWSQVDPNCPTVQYQITSNCGDCSVSGNTSATCSNLRLSASERNCVFSVESMICGFTGPSSNPITVKLKVPDAPRINVIPVYLSGSQVLIGLLVQIFQERSFSIYKGISGSALNYTVHYSSGDNETVPANCTGDVCEYMFQVPSTVCPPSKSVSMVSISAVNRLGLGEPSELVSIGCTNDFVTVNIDQSASTLTCLFQNSQNTTIKTCRVQYSLCDQEPIFKAEGNSTSEYPNAVTLRFALPSESDCYIYTVRACDGTSTVILKEKVDSSKGNSKIVIAIVVPVSFVILTAIVVITLLAVICLVQMKRHKVIEPGVGAKQCKIVHDGGINNVIESTSMPDFESKPFEDNEQLSTKGSTSDESCSEGHGIPVIGLSIQFDSDEYILQ